MSFSVTVTVSTLESLLHQKKYSDSHDHHEITVVKSTYAYQYYRGGSK